MDYLLFTPIDCPLFKCFCFVLISYFYIPHSAVKSNLGCSWCSTGSTLHCRGVLVSFPSLHIEDNVNFKCGGIRGFNVLVILWLVVHVFTWLWLWNVELIVEICMMWNSCWNVGCWQGVLTIYREKSAEIFSKSFSKLHYGPRNRAGLSNFPNSWTNSNMLLKNAFLSWLVISIMWLW